MGRPKLNPRRAPTEARLLSAAEREFGRAGLAGARLEDIARKAGISRPSLLHHFGSKDLLYAAVVRSAFARLGQAVSAGLGGDAPFPEQIDAAAGALLTFVDANPDVARLILRELLDGGGPGHALLQREAVQVLASVESLVRRAGGRKLRANLPLRAALMHVVAATLVRAAAGTLRDPLFGKRDHARALARVMFLEDA